MVRINLFCEKEEKMCVGRFSKEDPELNNYYINENVHSCKWSEYCRSSRFFEKDSYIVEIFGTKGREELGKADQPADSPQQ